MTDKQDCEHRFQVKLAECQNAIDELRQKAETAEADIRADCYGLIENLCRQQEAVTDKLNELRQSGEEAWEDLKPEALNLYDVLTEAVGKALEWAASKFQQPGPPRTERPGRSACEGQRTSA